MTAKSTHNVTYASRCFCLRYLIPRSPEPRAFLVDGTRMSANRVFHITTVPEMAARRVYATGARSLASSSAVVDCTTSGGNDHITGIMPACPGFTAPTGTMAPAWGAGG